jgi:hypothetical protein
MQRQETILEMVRRHIDQAEHLIDKQRAIVSHLIDRQLPYDAALDLLDRFEAMLEDHHRHLAKVFAEQAAGIRDKNGALTYSRNSLVTATRVRWAMPGGSATRAP